MIIHAVLAAVEDIAPSSTGERWFVLICGQLVVLSGIGLTWFSTRQKVAGVQHSADAAKIAVESSPTANGFARETKEALQDIIHAVARVESKVDTHLGDHAAADVRRPRGNRP